VVQVSGPSDFSGSQTSSGCDKRVEIFRRESFRVLDAEQDGAAAEKSVRRFRTRGFGERGRVQEVQSEEVPEEILVGAGFEEGGRGDEGRRAILLGFHPHGSLAGPNPVEQFLLVSGASAWLWLLAEHKAARSAEQAVSLPVIVGFLVMVPLKFGDAIESFAMGSSYITAGFAGQVVLLVALTGLMWKCRNLTYNMRWADQFLRFLDGVRRERVDGLWK